MAVEARYLNLYTLQTIQNREYLYSNHENVIPITTQYNDAQIGSVGIPLMTNISSDYYLPSHPSLVFESMQQKTSMNADSGLTCNLLTPKKRQRDCSDHNNPIQKNTSGFDIASQLQQYELEIDGIISQHTKKMRMEIEERQNQHARFTMQAISENLMKKMKEKDLQIEKMAKFNLMLQEKVKNLYTENQLWRDMAQTNEATVNTLRTNLEQVLAHSEERLLSGKTGPVVEEDVQSCCGSNNINENKGIEEEEVVGKRKLAETQTAQVSRMCRVCGERESCVLLLPCRHLCLCTYCGSSLVQNCPVCNSNMNATVHVNMSSS